MRPSLLVVVVSLLLFACQENKTNSDRLEFIPDHDANPSLKTEDIIAIKNGIEHWNNVSEINFTFNVDRGENHFERSWTWNPKTDDVTMRSGTDTISYNRKKMDSLTIKTDGGFVNDSYWLLAPYKLVWDEGITLSEKENQIAPISKDTLDIITITYGSEGGYTPGDAYDLYYDKNYIVREWVFRKRNAPEPSMTTTFEDYKIFNGLNLAKMHQDSTGGFKLHFTNISVKK